MSKEEISRIRRTIRLAVTEQIKEEKTNALFGLLTHYGKQIYQSWIDEQYEIIRKMKNEKKTK